MIPKALLECINLLDRYREDPSAFWKITKTSKGFSLVIRTFAAKNVTPDNDKDAREVTERGAVNLVKRYRKKKPPSALSRSM